MGERTTQDHYQVLGVTPDATAEQIRAAYRRLAFERHPDRIAASSPLTRSPGSMAEINAAWQVLGDEQRRHHYDEARRAAIRKPSPQQRSSREWDEPAVEPVPAKPVSVAMAVAGILPWIALVLVLGAIFVFTAYAGRGTDPMNPSDQPGGTVAVADLRGSCVQRSGGFTLVVNCAATPHEGKIVAQASLGASCPEGTTDWVIPQQNVQVCTDPATRSH